jgi:hypothetical protein
MFPHKILTNEHSVDMAFHSSINEQNLFMSIATNLQLMLSCPQVPCRPTWGSKYAATRKELELGARSRLPALEGVRGAC